MDTILKIPLEVRLEQTVETPLNFTPLSVQFQRGTAMERERLQLWGSSSECELMTSRKVRLYRTGGASPVGRYIGTVQESDGGEWHVFMELPL